MYNVVSETRFRTTTTPTHRSLLYAPILQSQKRWFVGLAYITLTDIDRQHQLFEAPSTDHGQNGCIVLY